MGKLVIILRLGAKKVKDVLSMLIQAKNKH